MPVKESEKMVKVGVDKELWRKIGILAANFNTSKKDVVTQAIQDYLARHPQGGG